MKLSNYKIGIDIGNSSTKINLNLEKILAINNDHLLTNEISPDKLLKGQLQTYDEFLVSISSVNDEQTTKEISQKVIDALPSANVKTTLWDSKTILENSGLVNASQLHHFGTDRTLRIYYLNKLERGSAKISCGCGSAFTVEVVQNGYLIESYILPGLTMQLESLHQKTAKLPLILAEQIFDELTSTVLFSTNYSIINGVIKSYTAIIERLLLEYKPNQLILSGGYAPLLKSFFANNRLISATRSLESEVLIQLL